MLRKATSIKGFSLLAEDGKIGHVGGFYFDDKTWTLRYLLVNTGSWLFERDVLIYPFAVNQPDWKNRILPVALTKQRVKDSPLIDRAKPVSRQQQASLHEYYAWTPYWGGGEPFGGVPPVFTPPPTEGEGPSEEEKRGDPHLRSINQVNGYHIMAQDGKIGHVEDFFIEDESWIIRYLLVDTRDWIPGKRILLAPKWIDRVAYFEQTVYVNLDKKFIKESPKFDHTVTVSREYEEELYTHYATSAYWKEAVRH